jgi:hypothetical protein
MSSKRIFTLLSLALAATLQAQQQTAVVAFDSQVTSPSGSQAPGEQYIFFGANPKPGDKEGDDPAMNLAKLTDFSVAAPGDGQGRLIPANPSSADCARVLAPGGAPVVTGILYNNRGGGADDEGGDGGGDTGLHVYLSLIAHRGSAISVRFNCHERDIGSSFPERRASSHAA